MRHKDYMNWLKENDPILYSDLTSDPTGGYQDDVDSVGCFIALVMLAIGFVCFIIFATR